MNPSSIVVQCSQESFWLYTLIWGVLLPLFLAYLASAAYAFQRRRSDIEVVHKAMKDMRTLTMLALDRIAGQPVDLLAVRDSAMELISRVRLEVLHRPEFIQKMIHSTLSKFLKNADIADGQIDNETPNTVLQRQATAESELIYLVRQLTVVEALRQAWSNPGIKISFDPLLERFLNRGV